MQHDYNIENKLREMEAMEQPDLSQMDGHWQQMAAILQPAVLPVKKVWPKWMLNGLSVVAVAVLIGAALLYLSSKKNSEGEKLAKQNEIIPKGNSNNKTVAVVPTMNVTDSTITTSSAIGLHKLIVNPVLINYDMVMYRTKVTIPSGSNLSPIKHNYIPCNGCIESEYGISGYSTNRQLKLQRLFAQLEKQEQHFTIDNSRDTLLKFAEGTVLLVPANSFGGMKGIQLTGKEFYKKSDVVLNQLNTESSMQQLETGGMLYVRADYKGGEVKINKEKPLILFMPDTSKRMENMQLFYGQNENKASLNEDERINLSGVMPSGKSINWVAQPYRFTRQSSITMVKVLNLVNMPYEVKEKKGNRIAYFLVDENIQVSKDEIKKQLKGKYGYDKIKLRNAEWWEVHNGRLTWAETGTGYFNSFYATKIGDSMWMDKEIADKYKLIGTATKTEPFNDYYIPLSYRSYQPASSYFEQQFDKLSLTAKQNLQDKYSVNLSQLGWVNCDRFYSDSRKKIQYKVDIGDSAANYYTMLVFDKLNSMMTGYINGNQVAFPNIPIGEPVKIISIGINKNGETVYSVTHTTTSEQGLKDVQFQATSAPELKTALSKYDN